MTGKFLYVRFVKKQTRYLIGIRYTYTLKTIYSHKIQINRYLCNMERFRLYSDNLTETVK